MGPLPPAMKQWDIFAGSTMAANTSFTGLGTRSSMRTLTRGSAFIESIRSSEGLSRQRGSSAPTLAPQEGDHLSVDLGEALLLHPMATAGEHNTNLAKFSGVCSILAEHELWNSLSGITRRETSVTIKIVFSKTLEIVEWKNARLVKEKIVEEISQMKQRPGKDLVIFGVAGIAQTFMQLGLIDEYHLLVHPIVLGRGKPLFKGLLISSI
jgi:RibD C-terminal domain